MRFPVIRIPLNLVMQSHVWISVLKSFYFIRTPLKIVENGVKHNKPTLA